MTLALIVSMTTMRIGVILKAGCTGLKSRLDDAYMTRRRMRRMRMVLSRLTLIAPSTLLATCLPTKWLPIRFACSVACHTFAVQTCTPPDCPYALLAFYSTPATNCCLLAHHLISCCLHNFVYTCLLTQMPICFACPVLYCCLHQNANQNLLKSLIKFSGEFGARTKYTAQGLG